MRSSDNNIGSDHTGWTDPLAVHHVLTGLLQTIRTYGCYLEDWITEIVPMAGGEEAWDVAERDLFRLWRREYATIRNMTEVAMEAKEPWASLPPSLADRLWEEVRCFVRAARSYRKYQADGLMANMYLWEKGPREIKRFVRSARRDVRSYTKALKLLKRPHCPIEEALGEKTAQKASPKEEEPNSRPDPGVTGITAKSQAGGAERVSDSLEQAIRLMQTSTFACEFFTAHYAPDHCQARMLRLMRNEMIAQLVETGCKSPLLGAGDDVRDSLIALWTHTFNTMRQVAEVVLFDIDDPFEQPDQNMVLETGGYLLRPALSSRYCVCLV
jgi:hypothetical protein